MNLRLVRLVFFIILSGQQFAQNNNDSTYLTTDNSSSFVKLSGEAGISGELYSISGIARRRPASSGMFFFRPTLTLLEDFSISFDFLLSTEGNSARQQINQLAIHPEWSWGKFHAGDFSHRLSQFTLDGINIRGAGVEIYPSNFRMQVVGGQIQRAVNNGAFSAFSRYLTGIKLGYGKEENSFFDLNILRVRDNTASLPGNMFSDSSSISSFVSPQENLVIGLNTQIKLFNDALKFTGEIAGDAYSKDMFSSNLDLDKMPGIVKSVFIPRISSSVDFAYNTELQFDYENFSGKAGYSVINPGYMSLGLASVINDKKTFQLNAGARLLQNKINIQGNFQSQRDNLLEQKLYTTSRSNYGVNINIKAQSNLMFNLSTQINLMDNNAANDTFKISNVNSNFMINNISQFSILNLMHNLVVNYSVQFAKDKNILRAGNDITTQNFLLSISTVLNPYWTISPSIMFNFMDIQNRSKNSTSTFSLMINSKIIPRMNNSFNIVLTNASSIRTTVFGITSSYYLTNADFISLNLRSSYNKGKGNSTIVFNEHKANLIFTHRF